MDLKTRILRWEHSIQENPAMLVLGIIVVITVVFIGAIFVDAFLKKRKERRRGRRSK